ncbi:hypothetical protein K8R32_03960 [bacterium]|nr:hypothetical protein [bacterium]
MSIKEGNFSLPKPEPKEEIMTDEHRQEDKELASVIKLRQAMSVDTKEYEKIKKDPDKLDAFKKKMFAEVETTHKKALDLNELQALHEVTWQIFENDPNHGGDNHVFEKMQSIAKGEIKARIKNGGLTKEEGRGLLVLVISRMQKKLGQEGSISAFNDLFPDQPYDGPLIKNEPPFNKEITNIDTLMAAVGSNPEKLAEAKIWLLKAYAHPGTHLNYVEKKDRPMVFDHRFTELVNANIKNGQLDDALFIILEMEEDVGKTRDSLELKLMNTLIEQGDLDKAEEVANKSLYEKSKIGRLKKITSLRKEQV